ncbi:MAG TPA: cytidylate kinase-like family protein [Clostridiales bacterium]|nr:cytidylate kinase-like family protein [Clostridiales bacterium]
MKMERESMKNKQLIISVGREYGSGGHAIAVELARRFELPVFDRNILKTIADAKHVDVENLEPYDEVPRNWLFSRKVRGHSSAPEEHVAHMQFNFLRKKAENGDSFVIVGRCAETVLRGQKGLVSIFILGDRERKIERIERIYQLNREDAEHKLDRIDKKRKTYHNYYCDIKWGDSRNYDVSINSSRLGVERTVDMLELYIQERMKDL